MASPVVLKKIGTSHQRSRPARDSSLIRPGTSRALATMCGRAAIGYAAATVNGHIRTSGVPLPPGTHKPVFFSIIRARLPAISIRSHAITRVPRAVSAAHSRLPTAPAAPMMSVDGVLEDIAFANSGTRGRSRTSVQPRGPPQNCFKAIRRRRDRGGGRRCGYATWKTWRTREELGLIPRGSTGGLAKYRYVWCSQRRARKRLLLQPRHHPARGGPCAS